MCSNPSFAVWSLTKITTWGLVILPQKFQQLWHNKLRRCWVLSFSYLAAEYPTPSTHSSFKWGQGSKSSCTRSCDARIMHSRWRPNKNLRKPFNAKTPNSLVSHVLSYNSALEQQLNVNTTFWEQRGLPLYLSQCCHCAFEMRSKAGALRNLWSRACHCGVVVKTGKMKKEL